MANSHMTFGVDLLPRTTNTYNLGNSNQKWNVWINQINGSTPVTSVNTQTGDVVITAANLGAYVKPNDGIPDIDIASAINWNAKQEPMVILSYGTSTWADFVDAYNKHAVVYCRASSNSNPASGAQTRLAFMAYINANPPTTEVEFQYYRSVSSHSATQMSDQVYVYKLNKTNGWSVTTREASLKQLQTGTGLDVTYSNNSATISPSLVSTTALANAATAATEVADRVYPVALDANGKLAVNVPWSSDSEISSSDVTTALGYTPYNSSNPMGYTSNVGTITGITMNGVSKGTSGVVDLGTVITDVSNKVSGPATATATHVATFSDTTGKVIQDSGYTIGTSVPSNAVFTDTTTSVSYSTTPASVNVSTAGATGSVVLGEAATKQVDSTVTSSSTNLPTSAAVATYVQQNAGSADWADITYGSMDTTDVDYEPGAEYLYSHIRPSYKDTIIGNDMIVTYDGYVTAANVTVSQVNVKGTGAVWQWIPTSTGLELVCAPTT